MRELHDVLERQEIHVMGEYEAEVDLSIVRYRPPKSPICLVCMHTMRGIWMATADIAHPVPFKLKARRQFVHHNLTVFAIASCWHRYLKTSSTMWKLYEKPTCQWG